VPRPEPGEHVGGELRHRGRLEPDGEGAGDAATRRDRRRDALLDAVVPGADVGVEGGADRREGDPATGALEQRHPEPPFQLRDRLADPGLGDEQPLGRAPEVQLFREGQEDLDLPTFHNSHVISRCRSPHCSRRSAR
jgi:hypothetical protein